MFNGENPDFQWSKALLYNVWHLFHETPLNPIKSPPNPPFESRI